VFREVNNVVLSTAIYMTGPVSNYNVVVDDAYILNGRPGKPPPYLLT